MVQTQVLPTLHAHQKQLDSLILHGLVPPSHAVSALERVVEKEELDPASVQYDSANKKSILRLYSSLCNAGLLDEALVVVKESIRAQRADVLVRLRHCKFLRPAQRRAAVRKALRFVQLLPREYVDAKTYNMLLSVCAKAGDVKNALRVTDMLKAAGLKMDTILYTNLIKACAAAGDAESGFKLYAEMKSNGVRMEKQVYTTLISACARQIADTHSADRRTQLVLLERAAALVDAMDSARLHPDAALWNALVTAAGRAGQLQRAFEFLDQMMSRGVKPNARTYASLIDACARNGDKNLAMRVYSKSIREGCAGELIVYSAAVNACIKARDGADAETAMMIYADMQRAAVAPDSAMYGALMTAAGKSGDLGLAVDLQAEMAREGLNPCSGTESALITVHVLQGQLNEAVSIYRRMRRAGDCPHPHAMNAMINAHAKAHRLGDVVSLVCDMLDIGLTPDAFTFAAVLSACSYCDESELALDVYRMMRKRGVRVEEVHARLLLMMCYKRLRQSWSKDDVKKTNANANVNVNVNVSTTDHQIHNHRAQERAKLIAALELGQGAQSKKSNSNTSYNATSGSAAAGNGHSDDETAAANYYQYVHSNGEDIPWQSHAFHIYRDAVSSGVKPSLSLLNLMLSCLRIPKPRASRQTPLSVGPIVSLQQHLQPGDQNSTGEQLKEASRSVNVSVSNGDKKMLATRKRGSSSLVYEKTPVQRKIGVESVYHVQAISILEEAIVSGLIPGFKVDTESPFDLRAFPAAVAEVYVLTVIASLQRQVIEGRRQLKHRIVFFVPRYDDKKVLVPSHALASNEEVEGKEIQGKAGQSNSQSGVGMGIIHSDTDSDSESDALSSLLEASEIIDDFSECLRRQQNEAMADEKTGLGVAGVVRRLRLWAKEYSPEGLIVVTPHDMMRWCKVIQRDVERRSASALALQKPYGQASHQAHPYGDRTGTRSLLRQQIMNIRTKGL